MSEDNKKQERKSTRRSSPTSFFSRYMFLGRRQTERRQDLADKGYYVDRYYVVDWLFFCFLVVLNVCDLGFTLWHINEGYAQEANPIMNWGLEVGGFWGFAVLKLSLVLPSALILFAHSRFPRTKGVFVFLNIIYGLLLFYHLTPFVLM